MNTYEIASNKYPTYLKTTILFSLIQAEQIEIEKEFIDTKFDSLSHEAEIFKQMCMEVINIEKAKINNIKDRITWKR